MKNRNFLALDLELNQPSNRIIQVGIAIGNALQSEEEYVVKKWYLEPYEPIAEHITALTGITDRDIGTYAVSHEFMAQELAELITEHDCFVNPVTWGGGDSSELLEEIRNRNIHFPHFGRRWIDVKTFYTYIMLSRGKNPSGGLSSAMGAFKLPFKGEAHRADVDAFNTLRFFFALLERQESFETIATLAKGG
jgi:inhibitor of KinA sporulation pathway (predicted exonuclease)